ncbi:uncharacterized protein LOC131243858 [Magnolia sinica]|uniref:uncharacterized protein LOC131243858 n=1 Tax=Magnolia sinica TaxID=86752 RepID=UPI00265B16EC|nr:uncharacterized protein LOC131243858 [Magnolia sinica]
MAKHHQSHLIFNLHSICHLLFVLSSISSLAFLFWTYYHPCSCNLQKPITTLHSQSQPLFSGHLPSLPSAWNHLSFSPEPPPKRLNIALFVKRWPQANRAGGMERHALTLHLVLARRGHMTHVFTVSPDASPKAVHPNIHFHLSDPTPFGLMDPAAAWRQFEALNSTQPFDVVHSESVGLMHPWAKRLTNIAVSWHGIAYEAMHTDIVEDLVRRQGEHRSPDLEKRLAERSFRIIEEVKFFQNYAHHIATSDHVGDILKRIYMIPEERVHVILNGVNEYVFKQDSVSGHAFRQQYGVPESAGLVLGMSGRLVRDKGHPIMFEALNQIFMEDQMFRKQIFVVVAGDGPWADRYKELGPNLLVLGPLDQGEIARFYNALDIFVHPSLRAQGFDQTPLEAMISGKPVMATRFASTTGSAIVSSELGYIFSPTVESLKETLYRVFRDGREVLEKKGKAARWRASKLFTATKMAASFERLFLCISSNERKQDTDYCKYPLPSDTFLENS